MNIDQNWVTKAPALQELEGLQASLASYKREVCQLTKVIDDHKSAIRAEQAKVTLLKEIIIAALSGEDYY